MGFNHIRNGRKVPAEAQQHIFYGLALRVKDAEYDFFGIAFASTIASDSSYGRSEKQNDFFCLFTGPNQVDY